MDAGGGDVERLFVFDKHAIVLDARPGLQDELGDRRREAPFIAQADVALNHLRPGIGASQHQCPRVGRPGAARRRHEQKMDRRIALVVVGYLHICAVAQERRVQRRERALFDRGMAG